MSHSTLPTEPFSSVDAAWLHMDTPTNLANITGVMSFSEPLDFDRLRATVAARLMGYDRFRQRVAEPGLLPGRPRWEFDSAFDMAYHLSAVRLPEPADHAALQDLASRMMSTPLDRSHPLWRFYYVENYNSGSALVASLHHSIADGIALLQVLLSLTDATPDAPWPVIDDLPPPENKTHSPLFYPVVKATRLASQACRTAGNLVHEGMEFLIHPSRFGVAAQTSIAASRAFGKLLLIPPDKRTVLKRKCGIEKRAAWSTSISIEDVKHVGQLMGGTINDILLSAVTGALRRYLEERRQIVQGLNIRAIVPVNLRPAEESGELGNKFGLVFLSLPVGVRDPIRRLVILRRRMDAIKNSPEAVVAIGILSAIGITPAQIEKIIVSIFGMKGTAVMTNVPGPRHTLFLAGKQLSSLIFWVPAPGNISLGVSIFSYAGNVILGIAADAEIAPDPERILELFATEFETLKNWGSPRTG
jgi:diacylglycerol O-acyltransferase / wax synthase